MDRITYMIEKEKLLKAHIDQGTDLIDYLEKSKALRQRRFDYSASLSDSAYLAEKERFEGWKNSGALDRIRASI